MSSPSLSPALPSVPHPPRETPGSKSRWKQANYLTALPFGAGCYQRRLCSGWASLAEIQSSARGDHSGREPGAQPRARPGGWQLARERVLGRPCCRVPPRNLGTPFSSMFCRNDAQTQVQTRWRAAGVSLPHPGPQHPPLPRRGCLCAGGLKTLFCLVRTHHDVGTFLTGASRAPTLLTGLCAPLDATVSLTVCL